jgi:hypothetical protein
MAGNPDQRLYPALGFDGVDDSINCGNSPSVNFSDCITACAWVQTYINKQSMIIGKINSQWSGGWFLRPLAGADVSKGMQFGVSRGVAWNYNAVNTNAPYNDGKIHCYIGVFDGTNLYMYMDGILKSSTTAITPSMSSTQNIIIGKNTVDNIYYQGNILKVILYNYAASAIDASTIFKNGMLETIQPAVYYPGNGSGSTLIDYSGNNNNGTISGAVWQDGKANGTLIGGVSYKNSPSNNPVYNFDGTGYIRATPVRSARTNMSVFAWARASEESYLLGRYDTGLSDRSWILGTDVAGEKRLRVLLSDDGTYGASHSKDYLTTANVFDNQWHMYGFTWDNGTLKLFVDGVVQPVTKTYDAAFTTLKAASTDLAIGARLINGSPSAYYTGQTGHKWIYNQTLFSSEVMQLYNETRRYYGK